jgi:mannose-6-phosphate isomerase-like protein (cupin superfamily)
MTDDVPAIRLVGPADGETLREPDGSQDRFIVPAEASGGGFALVEHLLAPRRLAAPLHRHSREDEYSYVLEGRVGAILGGEEVVAEAGSLLFKPRNQWHTFWNAGDTPARILEIISPGGFEQAFRDIAAVDGEPDPEAIAEIAARYGVDADFEATMPIIERHQLAF